MSDIARQTRFYRCGATMEGSAISGCSFKLRVPKHRCVACGNDWGAFHLGYPHLDPTPKLTKHEITILKGKGEPSAGEVETLVHNLQSEMGVPVSGATYFLPLVPKVTAKPKFDFEVLPFLFDAFVRRNAAEALRSAGILLNTIDCPATGKHAPLADFVQIVIPHVGKGTLAPGCRYCETCHRRSGPNTSPDYEPALIESPELVGADMFKLTNSGWLVVSERLVSIARQLGLSGLEEAAGLNGTIHSMATVPQS